MKKNDFTVSVIKSIKPVSFSYSRQGKEYEKYFSNSNLKHLIKSIDKKAKINNVFNSTLLSDQTKNSSNFININIKSSFNYITDLSSLNNFPLSMIKKRKNYEEYIAKMNLFNELFYIKKDKLVDEEYRKKRGLRIKKKYELQKLNDENDTTLDPGKYHPKYDIVQKRYPVAFFGESNNDRKKNNLKQTLIINKNDNKKVNISSEFVNRNKKKKLVTLKEKEIKNKENKFDINNKKINPSMTMYKSISLNNFSNLEKLNTITIDTKKEEKKIDLNENKNKLNESKNPENKLFKSSSTDNIDKIKCPIVFNKMPGRDRNVVVKPFFYEVDYSPNYEATRPHIPSIIFKNTFDCQKFKKYMTGKIIRSYCYTPDKYFILEINQNKDKNRNIYTKKIK